MKNCALACAMHQKLQNITVFSVLNFTFQKTELCLRCCHHHKLDPTKVIYTQNRNDVAAKEDKKLLILAFSQK
jgi:hypothetical protein